MTYKEFKNHIHALGRFLLNAKTEAEAFAIRSDIECAEKQYPEHASRLAHEEYEDSLMVDI